jgi:hypothetical protein
MDGAPFSKPEPIADRPKTPALRDLVVGALPPPLSPESKRAAIERALEIARRSNPHGWDVVDAIREDRERDYYNDHLYPWA